jgi:uncharacterized protein involved in type VI secretion and phage assembly
VQAANTIVVGTVSSLEDEEGLGRVRVEFPHLANMTSNWCRIATPMAGNGIGLYCRPDKGDIVVVGFEQNDLRRPVILGGLWDSTDKPPETDGKVRENNWRFLRSRSGHLIKLDDTAGSERIEIVSNDEGRRIVFDTRTDDIEIVCDGGTLTLSAGGELAIEARRITLQASDSMSIDGGSKLTLKAGQIDIN